MADDGDTGMLNFLSSEFADMQENFAADDDMADGTVDDNNNSGGGNGGVDASGADVEAEGEEPSDGDGEPEGVWGDDGQIDLYAPQLEAAADEEGVSDDRLRDIDSKKEAKRLGSAAYKRWKALHKKDSKKSSSKSKKDKSSSSGSKKEKKKEKKRKEKEKKKKDRKGKTEEAGEGDEDYDVDQYIPLMSEAVMKDAEIAAAAAAGAGKRRRVPLASVAPKTSSYYSENQMQHLATTKAPQLIAKMRDARRAGPLFQIALIEEVQRECLRKFLQSELIKGGILHELSFWLYDFENGEPAALALRTAALRIISRFPMEGEARARADNDDDERDGGGKRSHKIERETFAGIDREALLASQNLGRAVHALRTHADETHENRTLCVTLMTRFSRVFSGQHERGDGGAQRAVKVSWKCMQDKEVASPFEIVQTGAEAFAKAFMKPDPKDPTSYNNYLAWRPPVQVVTNLSRQDAQY